MTWFIVLAVAAGVLALGLSPDPHTLQRLHVTSLTYRTAVLVLLVPYGIIWYAAFYAFAKLKEYSRVIKGSKDGKAFQKIMVGMGVLAFGLVIPTIVSLILGNIASRHPGFKPASIIVANYLSMLVLTAFIFIGNGTRLLVDGDKNRPSLGGVRLFALWFIVISVVFTYLVMHYHLKHPHVYYLNTPLLIITFIIPYVYGWFMAFLSAYEFRLYAKFTKGVLYRRALRQLSYGIVITILGSVAIQFVANTFAAKASQSLGSLLVLDYALLLMVAIGLTLMAFGTKKLKKIEEV